MNKDVILFMDGIWRGYWNGSVDVVMKGIQFFVIRIGGNLFIVILYNKNWKIGKILGTLRVVTLGNLRVVTQVLLYPQAV